MNKRKLPNGQTIEEAMQELAKRKTRLTIEDIKKQIERGNPLEEPFIINVTEDIDAAAERLRKIKLHRTKSKVSKGNPLDVSLEYRYGYPRTYRPMPLQEWEDESESIPKNIKKEGFELLNKVFLNKEGIGDSQPLTIRDIESLANEIYSNESNLKDDLSTMLKEREESPDKQWYIRNDPPFFHGGFTLENLPTYNLPFESDYEVDEAHKMRMLDRIHELNEEAKKEIARIKASTSVDFLTDSDDLHKTHNE